MAAFSELPFSPAAQRNQQVILDVLRSVLPAKAHVLEIASGSGQHAAHIAAAQPGWAWQPSEAQPRSLPPIAARTAGLPNLLPPLCLDVLQPWPDALGTRQFDAVFCANMLHIAPWATCAALMQGAATHLRQPGLLVLYGPFIEADLPTAPSNRAFDADLQARNPAWGLRQLPDVDGAALQAGLRRVQRVAMPANNLLLVYAASTPAQPAG